MAIGSTSTQPRVRKPKEALPNANANLMSRHHHQYRIGIQHRLIDSLIAICQLTISLPRWRRVAND